MSHDGDPPQPQPQPPPENRFWSHVWKYWVTGGLAVVLAAILPVLFKAGPFEADEAGGRDPTTAPPPATGPPAPAGSSNPAVSGSSGGSGGSGGTGSSGSTGGTGGSAGSSSPGTPPLPVTPSRTPSPSSPAVSARVVSVLTQGPVTPTVTKVQVNVTFRGLKGRTGTIRWHTYNDITKQSMSGDSVIGSPVLAWDSTDWHPTFLVPTPTVRWQLQVTAYGPDGRQLATNHSNFTFGS
ncbi:hypothetical protein [Streptomyces telluris]|uniref:Uncharacterized protein n=1 Tax=Streptomyces telluris TaxID=2720021 RepID=A0A9X2LQ26_9ACTN|nr:hypothetical protein [Streptomyces telluris]MCQ8773495.1 hypothetical protein [Streptomyces telluris]NJP77047.1 hypothetical protein [Streptomyces telluris]